MIKDIYPKGTSDMVPIIIMLTILILIMRYLGQSDYKSHIAQYRQEISQKQIEDYWNPKFQRLVSQVFQRQMTVQNVLQQLQLDRSLQQESIIDYMLLFAAELYSKSGIAGNGNFVEKKSFQIATRGRKIIAFKADKQTASYVLATNDQKILYVLDEFYTDEQGNQLVDFFELDNIDSVATSCTYVDHEQREQLIISYQNGYVQLLDISDQNTVITKDIYQLVNDTLLFSCADKANSVSLTINKDYLLEIWDLKSKEGIDCIFEVDLTAVVDLEQERFLTAAIEHNPTTDRLRYYVAFEHKQRGHIIIYGYSEHMPEECGVSFVIPYNRGDITCSKFVIEDNLFGFYEKNNDRGEVSIWNLDTYRIVGHFGLAGGLDHECCDEYQHPVQIDFHTDDVYDYPGLPDLQVSNVYCLYANGLVDMWHCDLDRRTLAYKVVSEAVTMLHDKDRLLFLETFCDYLRYRDDTRARRLLDMLTTVLDPRVALQKLQRLNMLLEQNST